MPRDLSTEGLRDAKRIRKAELKAAKARAAAAKLAAKQAKLDIKEAKVKHAEDDAETNLELARAGLKRSFFTGKVVSVRRSRTGTEAHTRRPPAGATR